MVPVNEKYSIPGSIVLAGLVIAGAIIFARSPVQRPSVSATPVVVQPPAVAVTPGPVTIVFRPVDPSRDHIRGDVNAQITLIEYSDLECPFCKVFHATLRQALQEYPGKVRWVYRHFPLDALHSKARKEAEASECASEQGKFWEYVDRLFEVTPSNNGLEPAKLAEIAEGVALDTDAFTKCLESGKHAQRIQEDLDDAGKAGGRGTPHTVILGPKGETIPFSGAQPYPNLKAQIDKLLEIAR